MNLLFDKIRSSNTNEGLAAIYLATSSAERYYIYEYVDPILQGKTYKVMRGYTKLLGMEASYRSARELAMRSAKINLDKARQ